MTEVEGIRTPETIQVMPRDPGDAKLRQDLWAELAPILT